jgi:F-type H+-transporting ATPase subunit b
LLAAPLLTEIAEEASGIGALGIDLQSFLVYLLNFAVLAVILYFFAYKRILGVLDARSAKIKDALEEADRVRLNAQEQQAQMQRTLDEGRQEGQKVLLEARDAAERYREQQQAQARTEAEELLQRARAEIQSERDAAVEQVRSQFAGLAVTAAERIIRRSLDESTHRELIDAVLAEGEIMQSQG